MDSECVVFRQFIALVEVVDELLYSHRIRVRQEAVHHEASGDGIRGSVHVHGEGGKLVVICIYEWVDSVVFEERCIIRIVVYVGGAPNPISTISRVRLQASRRLSPWCSGCGSSR